MIDVSVTVNVSRAIAAFEEVRQVFAGLAAAARRAAEVLGRMLPAQQALVARIGARHQASGPAWARNSTADGRWQHDLCAAWIHGCPNPVATACDCTCHGGTLR